MEQKIEAILFLKAEPVSISFLSRTLARTADEIRNALGMLEEHLKTRGIRLIMKDDEALLVTAPELSGVVESVVKSELSLELSRAALETLTLVLYRGPINKSNIDFIRGVNSQFILRNLLVRGLVERVPDSKDKRVLLYRPTFELLQHLGVSKVIELPEYETVRTEVEAFEDSFGGGEEEQPPVTSSTQPQQ